MGILSEILGSGDTVPRWLDLIDSFHTSSVEEIEAKTKAKTDLMKSYEPFKIAQRVLAILFSATYIVSFFIVLIMGIFEVDATGIKGVISEFKIAYIVLTIVGFYFGSGAIEGVIKKVKGQ
tara:strand:- start:3695 stop:4057 length:363 start_codon:yes stop_codon:yes gene_type:complete